MSAERQQKPPRQLYYKLGIALPDGVEGICSCDALDKWCVTYLRGQVVRRKTPLFVFETLENALLFVNTVLQFDYDHQIWQGTTTGEVLSPPAEYYSRMDHPAWRGFWQKWRQNQLIDISSRWGVLTPPVGTKMVWNFRAEQKIWSRREEMEAEARQREGKRAASPDEEMVS